MTSKQFLILSCNTGGGHNATAAAMKEEIERQGHRAIVLDYLALTNDGMSRRICDFYATTVRHAPHFFGACYWGNMFLSASHVPSSSYYQGIPIARALRGYLSENSFDGIIATHLYAAEGLSYLKRHGTTLPKTVAISTDYICHPYWEYLDCDYHIIPHEDLIEQFVARGIRPSKLYPYGIPVRNQFKQKKSQEKAREELGLSLHGVLFLVMAGNSGTGHIRKLVDEALSKTGAGMVAVLCGNNKRLYSSLNDSFSQNSRVRVTGPVNNVADWMSACDVLFSKPGGLTSTEALVQNVPLVHTAPIPGCETANAEFFAEHGLSFSAHTIKKQIQCGSALVEDPRIWREMKSLQAKNARPDSAEKILSLIS